MHVHKPESKTGAGSGSGVFKTGTELVEGPLSVLPPNAASMFVSMPVYVCVAVICCPAISSFVVNGTQILP
jgi:hypothetical protein